MENNVRCEFTTDTVSCLFPVLEDEAVLVYNGVAMHSVLDIRRILFYGFPTKKYWLEAGGIRPISPHTLRHSFATHLIDSGADIRFVQELLGHSDVSTTEKYTHISKEQLRREFLRFHPRGR